MQPEPVTVLSSGKAMVENPSQVFGAYSHTIIDYRDSDVLPAIANAHNDLLIAPVGLIAGVFAVADKVDQDLENLVFVRIHRRHGAKFTDRKSTRLNSSHVKISYA